MRPSEPHDKTRPPDKTQLAQLLPPDAGDPAHGGGAGQGLRAAQVRRLPAPLYRPGGGGGRRARGAQARGLRDRDLPRARPRLRQGDVAPSRSSPSCSARRPAARRAWAGRCTCSTRRSNFLGGYGIVGGHIPLAAGTAFASKYRGDGRVTLCFFGDGSVPQGAFHEGVALAALWRLPVVFICENNLYSMGTPLYRSLSVADVSQKALAYGIARDRFDGEDVIRVRDRIAEAVRRARNESLPTLIEIRDLSLSRPLDVRRRPLPDEGGGRGVEEARSDRLRARAARAARRSTRRRSSPSRRRSPPRSRRR